MRVVRPKIKRVCLSPSPVQHASKAQQRKGITHVAIICDNTAIQPTLPQVVLASEHVLRVRDLATILASVTPNFHVWRRKSGWINKDVMKELLLVLGKVLHPLLAQYQPVLLMDAHSVHCAPDVVRAAARQHIWICIVPASMTFILQPLDTDVFARYKQYLRKCYQEIVSDQTPADMSAAAIICSINEACRYVLQAHPWGPVFCKNGFGSKQALVRESVRSGLEWTCIPPVPETLPGLAEFRACFPDRTIIPFSELFADMLATHSVREVAPICAVGIPAAEAVESWAMRLRPRRRTTSRLSTSPDNPSAAPPPPVRCLPASSSTCLPAAPPHMMQPLRVARATRLLLPRGAPRAP